MVALMSRHRTRCWACCKKLRTVCARLPSRGCRNIASISNSAWTFLFTIRLSILSPSTSIFLHSPFTLHHDASSTRIRRWNTTTLRSPLALLLVILFILHHTQASRTHCCFTSETFSLSHQPRDRLLLLLSSFSQQHCGRKEEGEQEAQGQPSMHLLSSQSYDL